jgi:MFS family permease
VPAPTTRPVPAKLQVRAVYRGTLGRLMTGITLFEAVNFAAVLLILRATTLLGRQDVPFGPEAMAVLLYLLWRLAAAVAAPSCGRLVDRVGPVAVMAGGVGALLGSYAGFAFAEGTVAQLALCFALAGAAGGAIEAAEHVGVARYAPESLRFSAFGALSAVRSFGRLTATVGATIVWTVLGPQWGMLVAAPMMVAAVAVMARGDRRVLPPCRRRRAGRGRGRPPGAPRRRRSPAGRSRAHPPVLLTTTAGARDPAVGGAPVHRPRSRPLPRRGVAV